MDADKYIDACKNSSNDEIISSFQIIKSMPEKTINQGFILLCQKNNILLIKKFLESDINVTNTTIGLAYQIFSKNGNLDMLKYLGNKKCSTNDICICIDIAVMHNRYEVLKYLFTLLPEEIKCEIAISKIGEAMENQNSNITRFLNSIINQ